MTTFNQATDAYSPLFLYIDGYIEEVKGIRGVLNLTRFNQSLMLLVGVDVAWVGANLDHRLDVLLRNYTESMPSYDVHLEQRSIIIFVQNESPLLLFRAVRHDGYRVAANKASVAIVLTDTWRNQRVDD